MTASLQPRRIGRYLLFDPIAQGGMATVYLARLIGQEGFSRTVAVKQLYPHFALDKDFVAMFLDEARLSSRIRHPNVVAPLDIIVRGSELFIVMEYVHGESLAALSAQRSGPWPPAIASAILVQVLLGLHAAHEATGDSGQPLEIVHRDVSPQNVLVGADGAARVVDFGIAKAASRAQTTQDGRLKGKLGYMAPEQIRQLPTDRRVDVFTSGVVLWELLTGRQLFAGDNPGSVLEAILTARIPSPSEFGVDLPPALQAVVSCALASNPNERFDTARAMAVALAQAMQPASTLEVSAFVEELAGSALTDRGERLLEVERLSTGDLPEELEGPIPPEYVPSKGTPVETVTAIGSPATPVGSPATPVGATPVPATPALPTPPAPHTDLSLIPSSASHAVPRGPQRSRRKTAMLGLIAVAALAAVFLARSREAETSSAGVSGAAPERSPAANGLQIVQRAARPGERPSEPGSAASMDPSVEPSSAAPLTSSDPKNLPPPRASADVQSPAAPAASIDARTNPVRVGAPSPPSPSPQAPHKSGLGELPRPVLPPPQAVRPSKPAPCAVPYVIDARGIKRFKPECF